MNLLTQPVQDRPGMKTLNYIVQNVMLDLGLTSTKEYQRFLQWGIRGVKEIGNWTNINLKTVYLTINDDDTVDYPDDYRRYTKIGIPVTFGDTVQVLILGHNPDLAKPRQVNDCGTSVAEGVDEITGGTYSCGGYYFSNYSHNGQYTAGVYGLGGGYTKHYYTDDPENNRLIVTSDVPGGGILLEYISTGISVNKTTYIKESAVETLIAWIHWRRVKHDKKMPEWRIRGAGREFVNSLNNLKKLDDTMTLQEYLDMSRRSFKSTPKH